MRLSFSVEAFISRAPRAVSVDPAVKRSSVPFPVRNPRVRRGPTMRLARASRVRSRFDTREGRRLAYLRDTRTRALPRSPPSVGTRCVVPAPSAREPVRSPAVVRSPRAFDRRSRSRSAVDRDRIGRKYLPRTKKSKSERDLRFQKLSCARRLDPRLGAEWIKCPRFLDPPTAFFPRLLVRRVRSRVVSPDARRAEAVAQTTVTRTTLPLSARRSAPLETMASTTLNVAVPRAVATRSRARRGGMPPVRLASRRGVRCAAGEEVPLGVQIETALMDAFPPRYVGDQTRAHPELERTRGAFRLRRLRRIKPNPLRSSPTSL